MRTKDLLKKDKSVLIKKIESDLNEFKCYKEGLQDAKVNAEKKYNHAFKMHFKQKRWWKITKTTNRNVLIWTNNSTESILIKKNGSVVFDDEMDGGQSRNIAFFCKKLKGNYFFGTRLEVLKNTDAKTELLPPVNMVL